MINFQIKSYKHFYKVMSSFSEELQEKFFLLNKDWLYSEVFCTGGAIFRGDLNQSQYKIIEKELRVIFNNDFNKIVEALSNKSMRWCIDHLDKSSSDQDIVNKVHEYFSNE